MAGIFNGPPRGGTRGGRDQFNWENVKADKDRDYYLGASVKALAGRWQKGKDVYWYTRDKDGPAQQDPQATPHHHELLAVKRREEELMLEALGLKPKAPRHGPAQPRLDAQDMGRLLGRDEDDAAAQRKGDDEEGPAPEDADRVKGLGYTTARAFGGAHAFGAAEQQERLDGVGLARDQQAVREERRPQPDALNGVEATDRYYQSIGGLTAEQIEEAKRRRRKEEKRAAKTAHAEREERKREKRDKKEDRSNRRRRSPSRSRSRSRSRGRNRSTWRSHARGPQQRSPSPARYARR